MLGRLAGHPPTDPPTDAGEGWDDGIGVGEAKGPDYCNDSHAGNMQAKTAIQPH